jgi:hypothetical protein
MARGGLYFLSGAVLLSVCYGCVSGTLKRITVNNELPKDLPKEMAAKFEIKDVNAPAAEEKTPNPSKKSKSKKKKGPVVATTAATPPFAYPNRRPAKDPIWVGEKLTFGISYFGVTAGDFTLEVLPFKKVGGRKVYHLWGNAISSPVFSIFYRLNDVVESYFDYEGLFSHRFHVLLDETKQKRDSLELYDAEKKQTYYWNRWDHKTNGYSETKNYFPIEAFSQDSMTAMYYARTLPLPTGSTFTFPVASEGRNWYAVCTVVRRETMDTPLGEVQTIVIKPEMKYQGILKKQGDSFLWLTDDDRRIPIRLEAKVKIGTVVAKLKKIELGQPPESMVSPILSSGNPEPSGTPERSISSEKNPETK